MVALASSGLAQSISSLNAHVASDLYSKREVPWEFVEGVIKLLISLKGDDSSPSTPLIGAVSRVCSKAQDVVVTLKVIAY